MYKSEIPKKGEKRPTLLSRLFHIIHRLGFAGSNDLRTKALRRRPAVRS